jgi:hypothetical protein
MEVGWEGRTNDILSAAFAHSPGRDWIALTLPHDEQPTDALAAFDVLTPVPGSVFPHKLCILHRYGTFSFCVFLCSSCLLGEHVKVLKYYNSLLHYTYIIECSGLSSVF